MNLKRRKEKDHVKGRGLPETKQVIAPEVQPDQSNPDSKGRELIEYCNAAAPANKTTLRLNSSPDVTEEASEIIAHVKGSVDDVDNGNRKSPRKDKIEDDNDVSLRNSSPDVEQNLSKSKPENAPEVSHPLLDQNSFDNATGSEDNATASLPDEEEPEHQHPDNLNVLAIAQALILDNSTQFEGNILEFPMEKWNLNFQMSSTPK